MSLDTLILAIASKKGIGTRCIDSKIFEEKETVFADEAYLNMKQGSSIHVLFSDGDHVLECHKNKNFIVKIAKHQKNVFDFDPKSHCCMM